MVCHILHLVVVSVMDLNSSSAMMRVLLDIAKVAINARHQVLPQILIVSPKNKITVYLD